MRIFVAVLLALGAAVKPAVAQPTRFHLVEATIDDVRAALVSKQITCRALVEQYIKRIEAYDKKGPALNALVVVVVSQSTWKHELHHERQ